MDHKNPGDRRFAGVGDGSESFEPPLSNGRIPPTRYDLQVAQALRRIIRAIDIYSRRLGVEHELTAPQLVCLLAVLEREPVTATSIARDVYLSASTVVGVIDRLEKKDLVIRTRDSRDRRVVNITSTEKGREVGRTAPSPLHDRLAKVFRKLPEAEQRTIAASLQRIVDFMEAEHLEVSPILETDQPQLG